LAILFLASGTTLFSQISGLGFNSYGVSKDLRTGIDLFTGKPLTLKGNLDLSFTIRLRKGEPQYFGYVFRLISGDKNLDLILNRDGARINYFTLVQEQKLLARIDANFEELCDRWNTFDFKFNLSERSVIVTMPDTSLKLTDLDINKGSKASIYFGLCSVGSFKTTDVPPMNLRDIKISEQDKLTHHWPLDEMSGQVAKDKQDRVFASVINPLWLKSEHFNWKEVFSNETEGYSWCAFDSKRDELILINNQNLIRYSILTGQPKTFIPQNPSPDILNSRQAIYDQESDRVYLLDLDKPAVASFDFETLNWSGLLGGSYETDFNHFNKFYSPADTSIYFFGGYGHHKYKNTVQKYSLKSNKLEVIDNIKGDFFNPRYLAGLGELNDTIYIIGGFGSVTGEQILNPHSYFDLMAYSIKSRSFTRKFEITPHPEDHAFSNSIVISPSDRSYYALTFPIFSYNGYLQLIKGSLDSPGYKLMGSTFPYQFLDIVSFSDLYFSRQTNKLVAVTIQNENSKSKVKVFTLGFPPDQQPSALIPGNGKNNLFIYLIAVFLFLLLTSAGIIWLRRRKPLNKLPEKESYPKVARDIINLIRPDVCYLNFFGDFQVISYSGEDITRKFTPLLKELFLLIWLNSIKNDIGISNEKIVEILWHGFSETSAQNNKAVNIAKLRAILSEKFSCSLTYKNTGYWRIDYKNRKVVNDYYEFLKITSVKTDLSKADIFKLVEFSQKGQFLANLKYNWLEEYKGAVANEMISRLIKYLRTLSVKDDPDSVIKISDAIHTFDNLNEEALQYKCRGLITLGRHTVAKEVYDQFAREYRALYSREYEKSFTSIAAIN
jgi:DNA-binding SARP family transcriptional activator